jgi:uncharacterized protein (TIGR02611 family)
MRRTFKQQWLDLMKGKPGSRFQNRYEQRDKRRGSPVAKVLYLALGLVLFLLGLVLLPAPGPGFLVLFPAAAMIAEESLLAAKALDWAEVTVRALLLWVKRAWQRASAALKALAVTTAAFVAAGVAWAAYAVVFN